MGLRVRRGRNLPGAPQGNAFPASPSCGSVTFSKVASLPLGNGAARRPTGVRSREPSFSAEGRAPRRPPAGGGPGPRGRTRPGWGDCRAPGRARDGWVSVRGARPRRRGGEDEREGKTRTSGKPRGETGDPQGRRRRARNGPSRDTDLPVLPLVQMHADHGGRRQHHREAQHQLRAPRHPRAGRPLPPREGQGTAEHASSPPVRARPDP